jgi:hypothetical protein
MTITDTANKFRYEGNGATDTFAFSGKAFTANDLIVEIITRATDALVETLTITTDYSVTIATNGTASIEVTNATKIPTALQDIQIRRSLAQTQSVALPSGTVFPASSVEGAIDRAVGLVQDLDEIVARSVKVPVTSSVTNITLPPLPEDDKVIAWDGVAGAMKNSDTTLSDIEDTAIDAAASASAAASSASAAATSASNASTSADEAAASAASNNIATPTASKHGALLYQNDADDGYDSLTTQGTSGQVLTSNGADAAPSFEDAAESTWVLLSTQTASASSTVDFTSLIDSTYKNYKFIFSSVVASNDTVRLEFATSTNNGSSFLTGVSDHVIASPASSTYDGSFSSNEDELRLIENTGTGTGEGVSGELTLFDPSNTSIYKNASWLCSVFNASGVAQLAVGAGVVKTTTAVNAARFQFSAGTITSGTFKLYGIN